MAVGALLLVLSAAVAVAHSLVECDGGTCNGDRHDNRIKGTEKRDVIEARAGNDTIEAFGSMRSDGRRDVIYGQGGADDIFAGRDNDYVSGGGGNDEIFDEAGPRSGDDADDDEVYGGSGADHINVLDGDGRDFVDCGEGSDEIVRDDGDDTDNCEDRDTASSASADSATVSAQQYDGETTESS